MKLTLNKLKTLLFLNLIAIFGTLTFSVPGLLAVNYGEGTYDSGLYSQDSPSAGTGGGTSNNSGSTNKSQGSQTTPTQTPTDAQPTTPLEATNGKDNQTRTSSSSTYSEETKTAKKNLLAIILGIICLLVAILLIIFAIKRRRGNKKSQNVNSPYISEVYTPNQNSDKRDF